MLLIGKKQVRKSSKKIEEMDVLEQGVDRNLAGW